MLLHLTFNTQRFDGTAYTIHLHEPSFLHQSAAIISYSLTYSRDYVSAPRKLHLKVFFDNDLGAFLRDVFTIEVGKGMTTNTIAAHCMLSPRECKSVKILLEDEHGSIVHLGTDGTVELLLQTSIPEFNYHLQHL